MRLPEIGNSNSHGARPVPPNYLEEEVDSDQESANKERFPLQGCDLEGRAVGAALGGVWGDLEEVSNRVYMGTSLIRKYPLLGPCSRTMSRAIWWS